MPKHRFRTAMFIVIAVVVTACEEGRVQQTDPEQQGSGVTGAFRSEQEGAVRSGVVPALVEAGNFNALSQTNLSAVCTTREDGSPDGSARIGNFIRPESVPHYEILDLTADQERAAREGARVAELLVYTRTKSEADYALIARDIKARYSGYDAVVIEFTDLRSEWIPYNGGALIFNTPCGALSLGYVYGPPNSDGFVAEAGAPPPLYPF
jgi:hypothetical protein